MLYNLYHFNHCEEYWEICEVASCKKSDATEDWGGGQTWQLLQFAYTISFLCLLWFDEVLKIQAHDIEFMSETCIKLTLPFRKTAQNGGKESLIQSIAELIIELLYTDIKPFFLHQLPEAEWHLCPVTALAEWLAYSKIEQGPLFPKMNKHEQILQNQSISMVREPHHFYTSMVSHFGLGAEHRKIPGML